MSQNVERILNLLSRRRVAVVSGGRREELILALNNSEAARAGLLRFAFPPEPQQFRPFLNGVLDAIIEASGYDAMYPGMVLVELDEESYARCESMPMAFLELLSLTTRMRAVILCGTESLAEFMACCASRFGIPGMVRLEDEGDLCPAAVEQTAKRLGIRFANALSMQQTVELYRELSASTAFSAEAFLMSLAGADEWISVSSIRQECDDGQGYPQMCRSMLGRKKAAENERPTVRRIGFLTSAERGESKNQNERSL